MEIKPGDKKCLIARARCYLKIGNAEKALDDSNEIHVNDPEYVKVGFHIFNLWHYHLHLFI